ncbi:hypothetical protein QBC43DRAFT_351527 [Cladorrhinum sp. PSN259]|nr:hypothetical protein QBC43DRAFT_351527 [Cladorrhinum sp. PSN259]
MFGTYHATPNMSAAGKEPTMEEISLERGEMEENKTEEADSSQEDGSFNTAESNVQENNSASEYSDTEERYRRPTLHVLLHARESIPGDHSYSGTSSLEPATVPHSIVFNIVKPQPMHHMDPQYEPPIGPRPRPRYRFAPSPPSPPPPPPPPRFRSEREPEPIFSASLLTPHVDEQADKEPEAKKQDVSYLVTYLDKGGDRITSHPLDKIFDLHEARREALGAASFQEADVFKVTTVVQTSIAPDRYGSRRLAWTWPNILAASDVSLAVKNTKVEIFSQAIIQTLKELVLYYPGLDLNRPNVEFESPYCPLVHQFDSLRQYSVDPPPHGATNDTTTDHPRSEPDTIKNHTSLMLDFLHSIYGTRIDEEAGRHKRGLCTYALFWIVLKPGTTVYVRIDGELSAHVIWSIEVDKSILVPSPDGNATIKVNLWHLDFDGEDGQDVLRKTTTVYLSHFDGESEITSRNIFPSRFLDSADGNFTRDSLVQRGKKWLSLLSGRMVDYKGSLLTDGKRELTGRVIVDYTAYLDNIRSVRSRGRRSMRRNIQDDSDAKSIWKEEAWGDWAMIWEEYDYIDHRKLILAPSFSKLALGVELIDVGNCSEARTDTRTIENLVMTRQRKDMIKALVHKHRTDGSEDQLPKTWGADFIQNKGEGQIFLLHGGPGVGKTYTAECIAEYTGRPLLSLTVSDVGTEERSMESQLLHWFTLAERWGAVMLIDEADIYLERRRPGDIKRNGLVSIFLRWVEYYKGVLFLTSNRVGQFDDAFTSRIHVIIHYPPLSKEYRKKIWEGFFEKLKKERPDIKVTRRAREFVLKTNEVTSLNWNGREIRNAFQTAVTLAQYQFFIREDKKEGDVVELDKEHFEEVCAMTNDFKNYLNKVGGDDEEMRAMHARERNDLSDSE